MKAHHPFWSKRGFVLVVAILGLVVALLIGLILGERVLAGFHGNPRAARNPALFLILDGYMIYIFARVIVDHFKGK